MARQTDIRFSFRIFVGGKRYIGPGRVQLMEGIMKHGSIARAAQDMDMSYRKAWQLVKDMNAIAKRPLVEKQLGGKSGGGAFVTEAGKEVMKQYYSIQKQATSLFSKASSNLKV
ncbi:MAG: LysR family transcriptional regulator [Cyclobacteriaceae bacterium]|nr:LysR family transcriptional regulator [Cyclobacteriaceae bacterium]